MTGAGADGVPAARATDGLPWWQTAVVYQIYPRSFCDTDGDGVGDLAGIVRHLDHLSWLGVDALWLSPFYRSPMADFGYDVSDYCDVDPLFGTLADFDHLGAEAHARDLKVIVDWVPNHSSDAHPWFVAARSSRDDPHRDWYRWRDDRSDAAGGSGPPGSAGRVPNNWRAAFKGVGGDDYPPAWTYDEGTAQWYLHLFLPEQPDLNWDHPGLRAAMIDTLRFWMARGVDGFRVDVTHGLGKDPALPDLPPALADIPISGLNDDPRTHPLLAELRSVLDNWPDPPERMMVGEVFLPATSQILDYYGTPERPELHLSFNFPPLLAPWDAAAWRAQIDEVQELFVPRGAWPSWVLSNHDQPRHRTRYGSEPRARAAAVLLLGLAGTPFLYAGEELGLEDAIVPPESRVDPGGRDGCRAPIPWDGTSTHGWAMSGTPWLPWPPDADAGRTATELRADPSSILWLYRHLLRARRNSPALASGTFSWVPSTTPPSSEDQALVWRRVHRIDVEGVDVEGGDVGGDDVGVIDVRVVAVNFGSTPAEIHLPPGRWQVEVSSVVPDGSPREATPQLEGSWVLAADEAVVLRPLAP